MRKSFLNMLAVFTLVTGLLLAGTPASAAATVQRGDIGLLASARCSTIPINPVCTTSVIPAHPTGHWIDYTTSKPFLQQHEWRIIDAGNGNIVARGDSYFGVGQSGRVNGLYGRYYMWVRCICLSTGTIFNS